MTGMVMSAAWMVEDGVIKIGGSELGRAKSLLAMSADWGMRERDFVIVFFRLDNVLRKG